MQSDGNNWPMNKIVAVSAGAGIVALLILLLLLKFAFWASLFWGIVIGGVVFAVLLLAYFETDDQAADAGHHAGAAVPPTVPSAPVDARPAAAEAAKPAVAQPEPGKPEPAQPEPAKPAAAAAAPASAAVKPSKPLPGQEDLAARKGDWKYEGEAAKPKAKTKAKAKPKKAAPAKPDMSEDYDKDGKLEGAAEGAKPATLTAPRGGKADNLKEIKGVGPKMEKMLNDMGFYHFDQIAAWSADETAWVNANLAGFKGRVTRDNWVEQAKILAAGGETEFSKRVDKGGVY